MRILRNAIGSAAIFTVGLGVCWLLVHLLGIGWDRALLAEILWIVCVTRWNQPDASEWE